MCLAVPGKIIEKYQVGDLPMGKVDFGGVVREACLAYVPDAQIGEYTVIHVGFAISRLSEEQARESLEALQQLSDLEEDMSVGPTAEGRPGA